MMVNVQNSPTISWSTEMCSFCLEWSAAAVEKKKTKKKTDTVALRGKIKLAWCHLYIEEHSLWQLWITYIMIIFTIKVKAVNRRRLAFSNLNKFRPTQKPVKRSA